MRKLCYLLLILFLLACGRFLWDGITPDKPDKIEEKAGQSANAGIVAPQQIDLIKENGEKKQKDVRMEKALKWTVDVAENDRHGYSQGAENATASRPYTGSREGPDYDCASLIYHALDHAGFPIIAAWQKNPVYYDLYKGKQETGDADTIWQDLEVIGGFTKYSWEEVKDDLRRGDILCRPDAHVAFYLGNGKTVEARGVNNPRGGDWRSGDQGGEIDFYNAYGRSWTEVYRHNGGGKGNG